MSFTIYQGFRLDMNRSYLIRGYHLIDNLICVLLSGPFQVELLVTTTCLSVPQIEAILISFNRLPMQYTRWILPLRISNRLIAAR